MIYARLQCDMIGIWSSAAGRLLVVGVLCRKYLFQEIIVSENSFGNYVVSLQWMKYMDASSLKNAAWNDLTAIHSFSVIKVMSFKCTTIILVT